MGGIFSVFCRFQSLQDIEDLGFGVAMRCITHYARVKLARGPVPSHFMGARDSAGEAQSLAEALEVKQIPRIRTLRCVGSGRLYVEAWSGVFRALAKSYIKAD